MSTEATESIGFIGIGTMGEPMTINLAESGRRVIAWNRTSSKTNTLAAAGAGAQHA